MSLFNESNSLVGTAAIPKSRGTKEPYPILEKETDNTIMTLKDEISREHY